LNVADLSDGGGHAGATAPAGAGQASRLEHLAEELSTNQRGVPIRKDYFDSPEMPEPRSIVPGASAIVRERSVILMVQRRDNGMWSLPEVPWRWERESPRRRCAR
jgi:hypothetical protein